MDSELAAGDAKLCGSMHSILPGIISKVLEILPVLEAIRPGSKSGIQALCALHVTLDKAKNILQHCSSGSKLYLNRSSISSRDQNEREKLEIYQAAVKLGITSSVAALKERRALKKLAEEAHVEQDKEKESTAAYVLHLMRNFSNSFVNEMSGGIDFQGSAPCTPTKGNFSPRENI